MTQPGDLGVAKPPVGVRETIAELKPMRPLEVLPPGSLRTARLHLRPLCAGDRGAFVRAIRENRDHLDRFSALHMPGENDDELFDRQLGLTVEGDLTGRAWRRMLVTEEGVLLGACNLNAIRRGLAFEGDVNWWLVAEAQGRGFATEALRALLTHAFGDLPEGLGLHRVLAGIQAENEASRRLATRVGFRPAGPERTFLHAGGKWDLHEMWEAFPDTFRPE
ncbi:MAG: GNAT family N-acetyltransferase [Phycisphaerales bacterium]|nr:GNAT family N-acetyltransferase [Phycisphaerales bacterium]